MTNIVFIAADGARKTVEVKPGISMMQAARDNGIDVITAECGGSLSCATCHAYVAEAWVDRVPPAKPDETAMLDCVTDLRPNSRLSCQIIVTEAMEGLELGLPESQY
jgi:ferredoxin, 2Fe-2S